MRLWIVPTKLCPYSFEEVVSIFWDRYPNSYAKHIVSEDVLERKITEDTIITKKLIVKNGGYLTKLVPSWLTRLTSIRIIPVIEESIYDKKKRTLVTYTRNVAHKEIFSMHERCIYHPSDEANHLTEIFRSVYIQGVLNKIKPLLERFMLLCFRRSITSTYKGLVEKLEERFGVRNLSNVSTKKTRGTFLKSPLVSEVRCEEK